MADNNYSHIFPLIRNSLWNTSENLQADADWDSIFQTAREQALIGVVFAGAESVMQGCAPRKVILQWFSKAEKIKQKNILANEELSRFVREMEVGEVDYKVVKGQVAASCYPAPLLRTSGDIDFWVSEASSAACRDVFVDTLKAKPEWDGSEKHTAYKLNGILYEQHSRLTTFSATSRQNYFDKIVEQDKGMYVKVGEMQVATLSPTLNALYIFIHLFQHLIHSGVGLRQMCDWMMWLHKYQDEIDRDELEKHLRMLALLKPYRVLGAILVDDLGLPETEFPFDITKKDRKRSRKVLRDIMELGNFGHNKENIKKLGFLHSLQTGVRMCKQGAKYVDLAPQEILCRVPHMVLWYVKKKL